MKSIFLISIVAITMIGLIIPIEFAEAQSFTGNSESVTAYYIGTIVGEAIFIVLVPVSIAYVIARLRFGGKKND